MTSGIKTFGTKIGIGNGSSPESFTNLSEGRVIPAIGGTYGLIDCSNHDTVDTNDYISKALQDGDEMKVEANYIPGNASQALFRAAFENKTANNFKITMSATTTYFIFQGRVVNWTVNPSELDDIVKLEMTIKRTGYIFKYVA